MLLAALTLATQAAAPVPAIDFDAPNWTLSRGRGSCTTTVTLSGDAHLLLAYHGGQNLAVMAIADPALALSAGETGEAVLRFGSSREERVGARVQPVSADSDMLALRLDPSRYTGRPRRLAEAESLTISFGGRPPVTHAVPGAREGVQSLLACAEEERAALPEAERLPHAALNSYFNTDDYPSEAVREHQEGTVRFWVTISTEGRVSDCRIIQSSGFRALDEATCRIARERVRYTPARDARGRPVASDDGDYSLTWRLP